jgi:CubicO group peptidase (beta-lactamase class C family)
MERPRLGEIDTAIRSGLETLKVPGCAFALVENGALATRRVYGLADAETRDPVTPETRFSLQSISKSMTAWSIMILAEAKKVDLDAPVSRYVTSWALPASDLYDLDLVTPRRLLSHHAGVTVAGFSGVEPHLTGYTLIDALDCRLPPLNEAQRRHWDYWKLAEPEPVSVTTPPGSGWNYSNAGYGLLQLLVEDVSGMPLRDFVAKQIFTPLNMSASGFGRAPGHVYASPHDRERRRTLDYIWPCDAAAGVYATIDDLATFACAAVHGPNGEPPGRGILSAGSIAEMYAGQGAADQSSGVPFEAGLGHVLLRQGGRLNVHHSGGTIGWRSIFSIFPETGDGICMLMNGEAANELWVPIVKSWRDSIFPTSDRRPKRPAASS